MLATTGQLDLEVRLRELVLNPEVLATFVYGTLRPGQELHGLLSRAVVLTVDGCTTPGALYAAGLPYADLDDLARTLVGTLLVVRDNARCTRQVIDMELDAGYQPRYVAVTLPGRAEPAISALTWHFGAFGVLVESGDWTRR